MYDTVETLPRAMARSRDESALIYVDGKAYRHHPRGGGLVAVTAYVGDYVLVDRQAMVKDRAVVVGSVRLFGEAVIEENAVVTHFCTLYEQSSIGGQAVVRSGVNLFGKARVDGTAYVSGGVRLQYFAHISQGILTGNMTVG